MTCALATLLTCFHLSGLYLESEVRAYVSHDNPTHYDRSIVGNPYASGIVGFEVRADRWSAGIRVSHTSSLVWGDQGDDSAALYVRWYPFGGRR